jgi:CBS domain-containing protein
MQARDIMTAHAICVTPELPVQAVVNTLIKNEISAVPVVSIDGRLVGIISEGDLVRRIEIGTDKALSSWLEFFVDRRTLAQEFAKSHGLKAKDIMTSDVITADPRDPISSIADKMEQHKIKRIPVVENGQVIGIVSRANLVQAVANAGDRLSVEEKDQEIREQVVTALQHKPWGLGFVNVVAKDGKVDLFGLVGSDAEKKAIRVAAERAVQGVRVDDVNLRVGRIETSI